jgi:hypothetical protein
VRPRSSLDRSPRAAAALTESNMRASRSVIDEVAGGVRLEVTCQ